MSLATMQPAPDTLSVMISNPYSWPYVRRGSERLMHDLSRYLTDRGHHVSLLTMGPENRRTNTDGVRHTSIRQRLKLPIRQLNDCHYFAAAAVPAFRDCDADLIHCLNYFDAFAALRARKRYDKSYKVLFHAVGIPTARYFRSVPLDAWFMRTTLREADAVATLSSFASDRLMEDFGRESVLLPPPVSMGRCTTAAKTSLRSRHAPRLLFVGDVMEPRKGARLACEAFLLVRERYPQASLYLSGRVNEDFKAALLAEPRFADARSAIHFTGTGSLEELDRQYSEATVTLLPSVWEAFGLVLIESLAHGTPVVGSNHAGIPDIIPDDRPDIGVMFDAGEFDQASRNSRGLADALYRVLDYAQNNDVAEACRAHASNFSWNSLGPRYESLYRRLLTAC